MPAAIGLRHPASASCLGRHSRLAGRCPNNSSLFPPLAAVVVVALWASIAERVFFICSSETPAGVSELLFYGRKAYPPRIVILPIILRHFLAGAARKSALFP
ncbi:hypothetical protein DWZ25_11070 [Faecalibacterium prausnitzii]|uniref:Uncharacterized protein n=1 Tax=Faecalibacterium prausnitzii TaxID=853 RepID=A0A3E2TWE3_9FIRM|nr:hypothetical protein DWZ25_11070 [Faecalibacterium prausnitzii]